MYPRAWQDSLLRHARKTRYGLIVPLLAELSSPATLPKGVTPTPGFLWVSQGTSMNVNIEIWMLMLVVYDHWTALHLLDWTWFNSHRRRKSSTRSALNLLIWHGISSGSEPKTTCEA
jgi:hypothetical protein